MAGFQNKIMYANGEKIQPSSSQDIDEMQQVATDVARINYTGNPEGVVSANPSSLCHDPVSGNIYFKQSGTGNTGWLLILIPNSFSNPDGIVTWNGTELINYSTPTIDSGGVYTNTAQPAFFSYLTTTLDDVTGDGTLYTVVFDTVSQQGSGYDVTTGIFTAPATGYYMFTYALLFTGITAAQNTNFSGFLYNTNVVTYPANILNTTASTIAGEISSTSSIGHFMTAGDTMAVNAQINGTGKIVSLQGIVNVNPVDRLCTFTGVKVA